MPTEQAVPGRVPALVAHRGDCRHYPENSLPALASALACGLRYLEFDVQLTADRVAVLLHDADLERACGVARRICALTAAQAAAIPLRGAPDGAGIATLAAALALVGAYPDATAFIEIKDESLQQFGVEAVLDAVLPVVSGHTPQLVLISFNEDCLRALAQRNRIPRGWVLERYDAESHTRARDLAPQYLFVDWRLVPAGEPLWPGPWQWAVYEVDDVQQALELGRRGAHLVESFRAVDLARDARLAGAAQP